MLQGEYVHGTQIPFGSLKIYCPSAISILCLWVVPRSTSFPLALRVPCHSLPVGTGVAGLRSVCLMHPHSFFPPLPLISPSVGSWCILLKPCKANAKEDDHPGSGTGPWILSSRQSACPREGGGRLWTVVD